MLPVGHVSHPGPRRRTPSSSGSRRPVPSLHLITARATQEASSEDDNAGSPDPSAVSPHTALSVPAGLHGHHRERRGSAGMDEHGRTKLGREEAGTETAGGRRRATGRRCCEVRRRRVMSVSTHELEAAQGVARESREGAGGGAQVRRGGALRWLAGSRWVGGARGRHATAVNTHELEAASGVAREDGKEREVVRRSSGATRTDGVARGRREVDARRRRARRRLLVGCVIRSGEKSGVGEMG